MTSFDRRAPAEGRLAPVVALLVAVALFATLPPSVFAGGHFTAVRLTVAVAELVTLVPLLALNPLRLTRHREWAALLSTGQALLLTTANLVALAGVVILLATASWFDGPRLLLAALQVWATSVIAFSLVGYERDRGGPMLRRIPGRTVPADYRFAQDDASDVTRDVASRSAIRGGWVPSYVDYLLGSLTWATALFPGRTVPLSTRAKLLTGLQTFSSFVLLGMVVARGVALLG